jgi:hypothetical protein
MKNVLEVPAAVPAVLREADRGGDEGADRGIEGSRESFACRYAAANMDSAPACLYSRSNFGIAEWSTCVRIRSHEQGEYP